MKKASIEILLLLSTVSSKKEVNDFIKEIKSLAAPEIDTILSKLEAHKQSAFQTAAEAIGVELRKRRWSLRSRRRQTAQLMRSFICC